MTWALVSGGPFDGGTVNCVCRSPDLDLFLAGGRDSGGTRALATSPDAITWTAQTSAFNGDTVYGVCWSTDLNLFVAVGSGAIVATSPDGSAWTARTPGTFTTGFGVAWSTAESMFVAVGTGTALSVMTSTNGILWVDQAGSPSTAATAVAYSNSLGLWAIGASGSNCLATSPDGVVWTPQSSPFDGALGFVAGIVFAFGKFIAVGQDGGGNPMICTSADGSTWTSRTVVAESGLGIAVSSTEALQVGFGPNSASESGDGVSWVLEANPFDVGTANGVAYSPGLDRWVIVGVLDSDPETIAYGTPVPVPPVTSTQYQRIYGWRLNISDDALETVDPMLTSPQAGTNA